MSHRCDYVECQHLNYVEWQHYKIILNINTFATGQIAKVKSVHFIMPVYLGEVCVNQLGLGLDNRRQAMKSHIASCNKTIIFCSR